MEASAQQKLLCRVYDREDSLSGLALVVLFEEVCFQALGLTGDAAAKLAGTYIHGWVPFHAWCAQHGTQPQKMGLAQLLSSVYGWLISGANEQKDIDKVNRSIFGKVKPW